MPILAKPRSLVACILPLLAVAALAACGGGSSGDESSASVEDVVTQIQGLSGKERADKLAELAEAEGGEVNVYTSSSVDYMDELAGAFEDEYGIDVSLFKSSSEGLVERIAQESDAGFRGSDVVETNADGLLDLDGEDTLAPYRSPLLPGLVAGAAQQDWTVDKFNTFTVTWNTDNVSKSDEPRSYEDLGDPRWKGKLVVEADDADWYKTLREHFIAQGEPASQVDAMFERIFRNAVFVNGHSFMTQLVASGEFDVSPDSYLHTIKGLIDKGAPIAWQPAVEPVVVRSDGVAVAKDAAHPAAALLFTDYVLGAGQQIFRDYALDAARKDLSVPPSIDRVTVDVKDFIANQDEWTKRYEQLTKLGTKGPEDTG